jgi:asparagine synthase (glutamine-hydrolysing)
VVVRPDLAAELPRIVRHYDEPFGDPSALPTWFLARETRREITVALTGDGGDEAFAGYDSEAIHVRDENFHRRVPAPARRALAAALDAAARLNGNAKLARIAGAVHRANSPLPERFCNVITKMQRQQLFTADVRQALGPMREEALFERLFASQRFPDFLSRILYADTKVYLTSDILAKVDRASMAHSLEVRTPLVDYRLFEFVATIPSSLKLHNGVSKYIFKKAVESFVPREIVYREKHGFAVPIRTWFRTDLRDMLHDHLLDRSDAGAALFERAFIEKLLSEHTRGTRDWSIQLWSLLVFRLWYRRWSP